ncbi:MAG: hypothetical protein PHO15_09845, partial [Eubacteriales bacterium]|nr:hypothetical protein [Eubacteriales bacterium]
ADFKGADEGADRDMHQNAVSMLESAGYTHYETSNFAKQGRECMHNLKYWTGAEYLGLGVAAHSYMLNGVKVRYSNTEDLEEYLRLVENGEKPAVQKNILGPTDEEIEYIMLRLRLKQGIVYKDYDTRFHSGFKKTFKEPIALAKTAGLITENADGIKPTLKGFDLQNTLIGEFIQSI